jgi:hypothetical protein
VEEKLNSQVPSMVWFVYTNSIKKQYLMSVLIFKFLLVGAVVLLALAFLMPTFYFIPKAVLGAVIITAVYPMIEYHEIMPMWRGRSKQQMHCFCFFSSSSTHCFILLFYCCFRN